MTEARLAWIIIFPLSIAININKIQFCEEKAYSIPSVRPFSIC